MNNYELTLVLAGKTTPAKKKAVTEKVEKVITTFKGKIASAKDWGELELAYKIKGNDSGVYLFMELEMDPATVPGLNDKLRVEEEILRYLLIRKDN